MSRPNILTFHQHVQEEMRMFSLRMAATIANVSGFLTYVCLTFSTICGQTKFGLCHISLIGSSVDGRVLYVRVQSI